MGREIRMVDIDWKHPKDNTDEYHPIFNQVYKEALDEWIAEYQLWEKGEHPDQKEYKKEMFESVEKELNRVSQNAKLNLIPILEGEGTVVPVYKNKVNIPEVQNVCKEFMKGITDSKNSCKDGNK